MKKLIVLAVLLVIGTWTYEYIAAGIRYARLDNAVIMVLETAPNSPPDQIRETVLRDAARIGVPLNPESVAVTIEETNAQGLAGKMLSGAGMRVTSKVAKLRLSYEESILGFSRSFSMGRQHTYTAQAAPPTSASEPTTP